MHDARLAKLADILVNYSVAVKKGDLVRIVGASVAEPFLVEIYKAALAAGGQPYVQLTSDECAEAFLKLGKDFQLEYTNPIAQHEIETIDCMISTWATTNTKHLSNV